MERILDQMPRPGELSNLVEVAGAYLICPFNRYELALTILDAVNLLK